MAVGEDSAVAVAAPACPGFPDSAAAPAAARAPVVAGPAPEQEPQVAAVAVRACRRSPAWAAAPAGVEQVLAAVVASVADAAGLTAVAAAEAPAEAPAGPAAEPPAAVGAVVELVAVRVRVACSASARSDAASAAPDALSAVPVALSAAAWTCPELAVQWRTPAAMCGGRPAPPAAQHGLAAVSAGQAASCPGSVQRGGPG